MPTEYLVVAGRRAAVVALPTDSKQSLWIGRRAIIMRPDGIIGADAVYAIVDVAAAAAAAAAAVDGR